jgi:hypothetical protein
MNDFPLHYFSLEVETQQTIVCMYHIATHTHNTLVSLLARLLREALSCLSHACSVVSFFCEPNSFLLVDLKVIYIALYMWSAGM